MLVVDKRFHLFYSRDFPIEGSVISRPEVSDSSWGFKNYEERVSEMLSPQQQFDKRAKNINFMMDSHSHLANHYQWWANKIRYLQALLGILFIILLIPDKAMLIKVLPAALSSWISSDGLYILLFWASIVNFAVYIAALEWNPSSKAEEYRRAVKHYFRLKSKMRKNTLLPDSEKLAFLQQLEDEYSDDGDIPKLPSGDFLNLKSKYLFQELLEEKIKQNPNIPTFFHQLNLYWQGICKVFRQP